VTARPGDHHSVHRLLVSLLHEPTAAEFQAQLEDPFYEPTDRLLVKRGEQIVAHTRLTNREMQFGGALIPISKLNDLVVLPEYRGEGCATELLRAAERTMIDNGTKIAFLRTQTPEFFVNRGWTICTRHSYSIAGARDILSRLHERQACPHNPLAPDIMPLNIRMWRHVEEAALTRLYAESNHQVYGPLARSDAYWRWLISRRAYDRIYVAIEGPDKFELDDTLTPIIGYAVMHEGQIAELVTAPQRPDAADQLLARACGDAIEHDLHYVRLDAAPDDPLHQTFAKAGGRRCYHEADNGEVMMAKLFNPLEFLRESLERLYQQAKQSDVELPCELGLLIDGERFCLSVRKRSVKLLPDKLGRSYLECGLGDLTQMLLGHIDVGEAVDAGRLTTSTRVAVDTARSLFPQLPFWRPTFDELPA
jgi:predicted acetyltransferase